MRLVTLRIRGYRRFRNIEVDCDHRRLLVVGPNEAGKSTLMEAMLAGIFGLVPHKRGSGHHAALRDAMPWSGHGVGLGLAYRLEEGRLLEADWDFTGERTQVVDHTSGADISAQFAGGTHGWLDVGQALLGVSATVFRQFTCVGEGELATISDEAEIRESLLRLSDSGVDVLVEQAIARLEQAARQSTIPRVNSATRRNDLERRLATAQAELDDVIAARAGLESEVRAIADTELALEQARDHVAEVLAEDERRQEEQRRLGAEIERAHGRLAEAEQRRASLSAEADDPDLAQSWSDAEIEAARLLLVSPQEVTAGRPRLQLTAALLLVLAGIVAIAGGLLLPQLALAAAGAVLAAIGVLLLTREGPAATAQQVAGQAFPDRAALMVALDRQRAQRELAQQQAAIEDIRARLGELLAPPPGGPPASTALADATTRQTDLRLRLERQRASLAVRGSQVGDVAVLEEQVATLGAAIADLQAFGDACRMASQHLAQASEEIRRAYAPRLQAYLSRDLPRITAGRYSEAVVNDRFEVMVRVPETNQMVEMGRLSRGTQQQVYLLLRLGLLEIAGSSAERLPLFLDDALALSDDDRRAELLRVLEAEDRQVIYFTANESTAAAAFGDEWHRVILPGPGSAASGAPELKVVDSPLG